TTYNPIGSLISFNSDAFVVNGNTPGSLVGVDSGAGFFTVTVDISGFAENTLSQMRLDPIGGAFSNSGSQTAGNFYEIDFIQISTIPEPASLMLVGLGGLAMLTRRRART
ncbi:MAG: PEP-CTERM sorting domain-containing protein, partial [Planctomycetota bacterium]